MDKILQPNIKLEPCDGTGTSLKDAKIRNSRGLCAIQGCGKPVNRKNVWAIGYCCDDCHAIMLEALGKLPV